MDRQLKKLFACFSSIGQEAYKSITLVCNPVLSKNPFVNDILKTYLAKTERNINVVDVIIKLVKYYVYSFYLFTIYIIDSIMYNIVFRSKAIEMNTDTLIDSYFIIRELAKSDPFKDKYFPGLVEFLHEHNFSFLYVPKLDGYEYPYLFFKAIKSLANCSMNIALEFSLLKISDYFRILIFILKNPVEIFKFCNKININTYENRLIRYYLLDCLDKPNFYAFARYLFGLRLADASPNGAKCLSWYENQEIDKAFYRGLRTNSGIYIFGCQLFIWSPNILNIYPDPAEIASKTAPDKVVVSGPIYIQNNSPIPFTVGPALRYAGLFKISRKPASAKNIIVLLPYFDNMCRNIINLLSDNCLSKISFHYHFHPSTNINKHKDLIHAPNIIIDSDIYECFYDARIAIGTESGSLIEAACMGIPVIHIDMPGNIIYNPFPEYGRGLIWDKAETAEEIFALLQRWDKAVRDNHENIVRMAAEYKVLFFTEPSPQCIAKAFDLHIMETK
jgi:hypothetical protein